MSKTDYDEKDFEPKIGFEKSIEDSSFSFSEFEKNSIHSPGFIQSSESVSQKIKENNESSDDLSDSKGLNQAFFEEKSESVSLGEPIHFIEEVEETTQIKISASYQLEKSPDIIENLKNNQINLSKDMNQDSGKEIKRKTCCEKLCLLL